MSDFLDENKEITSAAETDDGMLIIFPDEDGAEETADEETKSENEGESFSLSFGKVNAARKEEEFNFLPFLNIPEVIDEDDEEEDDDGESFSLSFGKVSAAKKEQDYVYMPFLNVDENAVEDETEPEDDKDEDEDSGIDIVGGDELFDLTPLKTRDSAAGSSSKKRDADRTSKASPGAKKQPQSTKGKGNVPQKKKQPQRSSAPQKPNKVQQILAQMDPDIIASVSSDPRQMMMLEETIRSELIKQAAHNAVARELSSDVFEIEEPRKKRPAQQSKQRPSGAKTKGAAANSLSFSKQQIPKKSNKPISIVDTSTISEFGSEAAQVQPIVQPVVQQPTSTTTTATQTQVQQLPGVAASTPIITHPVIVQPQIQNPPPVQQPNAASASQSNAQRKAYTPTSPAAIRAAMKSGALSFDTPATAQASETSTDSPVSAQSAQNRKRMEIQKQLGEKRSGCVIGAIALLMVIFIAIIALISGGDILTQCNYNEQYSRAQALVQQNDYLAAIDVLEEIKGYSQTASLLNECYFALGKQSEESGDYETAILYYDSCVEYNDAVRSKLDLQKKQADELRAQADENNDSNSYLSAYSLYVSILADFETYPDVAEGSEIKEVQNKTDSTRFTYAKILFEEENYTDAKVHFDNLMLSSYAEADTWYYNCCYNLGRVYFENGNYLTAVDELKSFEDSRNGLDDVSYSNALAYLALSKLYIMEDPMQEETRTLQELFSLFAEARDGEVNEDLSDELANAMTSDAFNGIKLIGLWENDYENYIVFENGGISFYVANAAADGLSEVYSDEVRFENGNITITVDGTEHVIMNDVSFESTYQMAPQTLIFVNPYDGMTYRMHRTR